MADSLKKPKKSKPRAQYAALPFRYAEGNRVEVMLITSRETRRWIIPKGWRIKGLSPAATAAREAFEEAGIKGEIRDRPLGTFRYQKRMTDRDSVPVDVEVFALEVGSQVEQWPEKGQRETRWFSANEAASLVEEPELACMLRSFGLVHPSPSRPSPSRPSGLKRMLQWVGTRRGLGRR